MSRKLPPFVPVARKAFMPVDRGGDVFWNEPRSFSRWEAWIDLIQSAARIPRVRMIERPRAAAVKVDLDVGEVLGSIRFFAERWRWPKRKVETFLARLARDLKRIEAKSETPVGTVYRLVNFEVFNRAGTPNGAAEGQQRDTDGTATGQNSRGVQDAIEMSARENQEQAPPAAVDVEDLISEIIRCANRGMIDGKKIPHHRPIDTSGTSRQIVADWLEAGIPAETIKAAVYEKAKAFKPTERNRQISSLKYLDGAVRDAWEGKRSSTASIPEGSPAKQVRSEYPKSPAVRSGKMTRPGEVATDEELRIADEKRRVEQWATANPEEAARLREDVARVGYETGVDQLGMRHFAGYVESTVRRRVIDGILTPKAVA